MNYVNLMGNVVPSKEDISNRMRDEILAGIGQMPEWMFTMQKIVGVLLGAITGDPELGYQPSEQEMAEFKAFGAVAREAQAKGRQATLDAALLKRVLDAENGVTPLEAEDQEGQALLEARALAKAAQDLIEPAQQGEVEEITEQPQSEPME